MALLSNFLDSVQAHNPEPKRELDRHLNFLERQMSWMSLFSLSAYTAPKAGEILDPKAIQTSLAARPKHNSKDRILRQALASLESEEGRWVYNHRRSFWIATLRFYADEVANSQPEPVPLLEDIGSASANDLIRHYTSLSISPNYTSESSHRNWSHGSRK